MKGPIFFSIALMSGIIMISSLTITAAAQDLLEMHAECNEDSECETGNCYYGFQIPGTPGHCQCNLENHNGCPDGRKCIESTFIADIPPFCALSLGSACRNEMDCETGNCANGICQCNHYVHTGCNLETEICIQEEQTGNYNCHPKEDVDL